MLRRDSSLGRCLHWVQDHEDLSGGLFEDEDTRVFYEDLPNLRDLVPEVRVPATPAPQQPTYSYGHH